MAADAARQRGEMGNGIAGEGFENNIGLATLCSIK
jgi:hypothetical protein